MPEPIPIEFTTPEPHVVPAELPPTIDQDFGVAELVLKTDEHGQTSTEVRHADQVIGVSACMVDQLQASGALVDGRLTLDTAGRYVFEHRGPSTTRPGVELFERVPVVTG